MDQVLQQEDNQNKYKHLLQRMRKGKCTIEDEVSLCTLESSTNKMKLQQVANEQNPVVVCRCTNTRNN